VIAHERPQLVILVGLSLGVVALTAVAYASDHLLFQRFIGGFNPLIAISIIVVLGGTLSSVLLSRGWFAVLRTGNPGRFVLPPAAAALLAAMMILVDLKVVFPENLNILFPHSLLYYPVMGYAAEIVFHLLPLSLLLILFAWLAGDVSYSTIIWPCIFFVSLLEPAFQTIPFVGHYPSWAVVSVALLVWAVNAIELLLFKRFDFVSMYSFRLAYYLAWHILWGQVRIGVLF
jgi:hypothetical protein